MPNSTGPDTTRARLPIAVIALACVAGSLLVQAQSAEAQSHPIPPGVRQADQAEAQNEKNIPPPANLRTHIDFAKLDRDAADLAALAQTIPGDVASVRRGMLPKDTIEKLKQIEKLAKHLRSQISPQN
jgi:hypothetical protein